MTGASHLLVTKKKDRKREGEAAVEVNELPATGLKSWQLQGRVAVKALRLDGRDSRNH